MNPTATRTAHEHATYNGDARSILDDGPKGPNTTGELMWPVTVDYDPATNKTRVGFSVTPPADADLGGLR